MFFLCLPRERTREKAPRNKRILLFFRLREMGARSECPDDKNIHKFLNNSGFKACVISFIFIYYITKFYYFRIA